MFTMLPQPNDLPLTTDDYKLQNQNIQALFIGVDKIVLRGNENGTVSIMPSGPIDAGGILYLNNEEIILTPTLGSQLLKVKLTYGGNNTLIPVLTDEDVFFEADRFGWYTSNGERVLNKFLFINGGQMTIIGANKEMALAVGESTVTKTGTSYIYSDGTWNLGNPINAMYSSSSWLNSNNELIIPKTGIYKVSFGGFIRITGSSGIINNTSSGVSTLVPLSQNCLLRLNIGSTKVSTFIEGLDNITDPTNVVFALSSNNGIVHVNAGDTISISTQNFAYISVPSGTLNIHFNLNLMIQEF